MKEILNNLALIDLITFCKVHSIDCSDTQLYKYPRKWIFALVKNEDGRAIVSVQFHKNRTPDHQIVAGERHD